MVYASNDTVFFSLFSYPVLRSTLILESSQNKWKENKDAYLKLDQEGVGK